MEPPINDDEFDALWEKAAADATRNKSRSRVSMIPKEPSERRKPRPETFPALSPQSQARPKFASPVRPLRRASVGANHRPSTTELDSAKRERNIIMVRSLPLPLEPAATSPKLERKVSREPPRGKAMRRHSSMDIDDIASSSRSSRRNSA
jgi:hypothetical protein